MKSTIKLFLITIIILSFSKITNGQLQEHYKSFTASLSVPIVVDYLNTRVWANKDRDDIEEHIPDKSINIGLYMRVQDMKVDGNHISGKVAVISQSSEEFQTFHGTMSADRKMINHLVLTRDYKLYSIPDREKAYIEEEIHILLEMENIPLKYSNYAYKKGVTKIVELRYVKQQHKKHYYGDETYVERFVKVDDSKPYGPSMSFNASVGKGKKREFKYDKIAVVNQLDGIDLGKYEVLHKGMASLIIADLMKVPGLKVLERTKIQKLLDEIALSQSGLVSEKTAIRAGRIMMPDIEIIVGMENRVPKDTSLPIESFVIRSKIRIVETGQIIDPNLTYLFNCIDTQGNEPIFDYPKKVSAFAQNFVYD